MYDSEDAVVHINTSALPKELSDMTTAKETEKAFPYHMALWEEMNSNSLDLLCSGFGCRFLDVVGGSRGGNSMLARPWLYTGVTI